MPTFSASWVFPISSPPIKNGVVTIDEDGVILNITESSQEPKAKSHHEGIIIPGFINTHCHLELSHMKGQVSEGKGMAGFISELVRLRRNKFTEEQIKTAVADAELEMIRNGIVAVGDISNTDHSFAQKAKGNIYYHTFIEVFDIDPDKAKEEFDKGIALQQKLKIQKTNSKSSLVPHAPYSVSPDLFELINEVKQEITCIHNQESKAENDLFIKKSGPLLDLFHSLGFDLDWIDETGKNSIRSTLPMLLRNKNIQLVHNTFTSKKDLSWAQSFVTNPIPGNEKMQLYWCTCPNANMYIENKLPDYKMFMDADAKVTVGTDSYASNHSLSIIDELKTITKLFPNIPLETLLKWSTANGAEFLGIEKTFGSIEKGKKPGLIVLEDCDLQSIKITENTKVNRLV